MYRHNRSQDFMLGALTGGAIAVLTTLFCTTKTGKKLQQQIVDKYHDLEDGAKEMFSDAKDKAEETFDEAGKKIDEAGKKVASKVKEATSHDQHK